ncbi:MAG TPA: hypothetical protein VFY45_20475 [Baekduia sp.]|nr:hypothetical protein [Baekduia sp.]
MITKPQGHTAAPRLRRLADALPVIVLGVGLLVVLIVVVTSEQQTTFAGLRAYLSDDYLPKAVGTLPPFAPFPPIDPFSAELAHRSWVLTMLFEVTYLASTMAIGSRIVPALRGDDEWPAPVRRLAGFLPGYLMTLAPLQLLFSALPLATASWIGLAAVPASAIALHWRGLLARTRDRRLRMPRRDGATVAVIIALAMVVVAAIHRLQQGIFHLTQDSIIYFLNVAEVQLQGGPGTDYLAHWKTQTDEWLFNAPLMFSDGSHGDLWFPFYLTQSVSLAGFLCLVYGIVHRIARRRKTLAGSLAVAAVFGSTLAIYPWVYVQIVGGGQPVIALAHPGRHIGIIAPIAALLIMQSPRKPPLWALTLATLGLGFVTLNDLMYIGLAVTAGLIWHILRRRPAVLRAPAARIGVHATLILALALPIVAYSFTRHAPSAPIVPTLILAAACLTALSGATVITWGTTKGEQQTNSARWLAWYGAWIVTATLGLLFSDNLGAGRIGVRIHDLLAPLLPGFGAPAATRNVLTDGVFTGLHLPVFSQGACDSNTSCGGIPNFLMGYGVLFSLILAAWVAYGRLKPDTEKPNQHRVAMLLGLAALPPAMILVFFAGAETQQAGALTRMLEAPYYTLLVLGVLAFCELRQRWVATVGVSFLTIWTIVPLLSFEWPAQMARNAEFYLQKFGVL